MNYLIVGLGNVGPDYENTRHNIGFDVVDCIAQSKDASFTVDRLAYRTEVKVKGRKLVLIKPTTFMNLSGKAVNYWLQAEHIGIENLLVITDDLALPLGSLRMKGKGSDGGHNGLKDIEAVLGTPNYARLRFGVGNAFAKGKQVDFVLGKWEAEELPVVKDRINLAAEAVQSFCSIGIDRTMNLFNKR